VQHHSIDLISVFPAVAQIAVEARSTTAFLSGAAEALRSHFGAQSVSFLQAGEGNWEGLAHAGEAGRQSGPSSEIAAEALDRDGCVLERGWAACPLVRRRLAQATAADGIVLAVQVPPRAELARSVEVLAEHAGTILCLLDERLRKEWESRRLSAMLALCQEWYQTTEMEPLLSRMAEAATTLIAADRASIFLWDKPNHLLVGRPALGMADGELRVPDDAGIVGEVIRTRATRRLDSSVEPGHINRAIDAETGYTTRTVLCVPLVTHAGECLGAFEVLNKRQGRFTPEDEQQLVELARHAAQALDQTQQWEQLLDRHEKLVEQAAAGADLIGNCPQIEALRSSVARIADTDLAVLLLGQNGTGKEVVARQLHFRSRRRGNPFVAVNCAALTETLLESELFGHEKGAFTDAHESRAGKFELASGGTLFLDEIGDMSAAGQAKLLRVLEDKKVVRVGGSAAIHSDVRIIAATNQNLTELVKEGRFRKDLYFRLNVVMLDLPPLVERGDDVLLLAEHFLSSFCRTIGRRVPKLTAAASKKLVSHPWPGNVRELKNMMERLAYLSTDEKVDVDDLAFADPTGADRGLATIEGPLTEATRQFQVRYVERALERARGNVSEAARMLGLHRSNLYRKMRQLGMEAEE
jgi:transcriptional regulator with GAF, ATPase, and Fis domain